MHVVVEVWGLAAGIGSTKEAARGAFTWRAYKGEVPRQDWFKIIKIIEKTEKEKTS